MSDDTKKINKGGLLHMLRGPRGGIILSLALIAVGVIVTVRSCSSPLGRNGYEYVRGTGDTINVAIDYSPMSLYRYGDTLAGFNYTMMKEMASLYGDNIKFYPISSITEALDELDNGTYDIVVSDLPVTAVQKEKYLFTEPVYLDKQVLISRDSTIRTALDLAGKDVWVVKGSPAEERMQNLSREIGDSIHVHSDGTNNAEQLFMLTATGDVKAAVINEDIAKKLTKEHPEVQITTPVSFNQFESWVVNKKRTALADTLNARIQRFKATPKYQELVKRYIDGDSI